MKTSIVMLTGVKQCGKDTCGLLLQQRGYVRFAFADILKEQIAQRYQLPISLFHGELKEVPCIGQWTPRSLCIAEGTLARSVDENVWAKLVLAKMRDVRIMDGVLRAVITDCRYQNEIDMINPDWVIRIVRPGYEPVDSCDDYDNISRVDVVIMNDGKVEELCEKLARVLF
jgi:hypothetical protein